MHYTKTKEIINNVLHYNKIMKHRTMTFLKEHPEYADSLKLYFDATAINIENMLLQMVSMTGVSKSTVPQYNQVIIGQCAGYQQSCIPCGGFTVTQYLNTV